MHRTTRPSTASAVSICLSANKKRASRCVRLALRHFDAEAVDQSIVTVTARRFWAQLASSEPIAAGRSLP